MQFYVKIFISGGSRISETGGANFQGGDKNLLFGQFFPENCMKMKEFGPGGGGAVPPLFINANSAIHKSKGFEVAVWNCV